MSPEIAKYHQELEKIKNFGGDKKETAIRTAFQRLLNSYCLSKGLLLVTELEYNKTRNYPDGTVKDALRLDWGWWEAKDEDDDLDKEISKKLAKGYPSDNIIFEDSQTAVLFQSGVEASRIEMKNSQNLDKLLKKFLEYKRPEIVDFNSAIEVFRQNIPIVVGSLRELIVKAWQNTDFQQNIQNLLAICRESIDPKLEHEDIIEMLIQHILTEEIFSSIFGESQFHRENNIARELDKVEKSFFFGRTKRDLLIQLENYYNIIKSKAAAIADHHEKQKFLKVIYESFYRNYNPEKADTLGIVYTPGEIVSFMVKSCDNLAGQFFGKNLADKNVKILDPATGTGTFITEIIDFLPKQVLKQKYKEEIFCNEIAILPYYVANLNIEYTYKQKMGEYEEFDNISFVDTLDNLGFGSIGNKNFKNDLFGSISAENLERIQRQNSQEISIIIGNPPYNANQMNFNDNNANREYKEIDGRIKETYIKNSTAQKTKQYDMYKRFLRWSSDRIAVNGIVAMIINRAFIDARQDDGFRKSIGQEFDQVLVVDLGGDARKGDKDKSIFDIQLGVAILFLIKTENKKNIDNEKLPARINYWKIPSISKADKLLELSSSEIYQIPFQRIIPDKKNNWLNQTDNDWQSLTPLTSKNKDEKTIFKLVTLGVSTNRDFWVYDLDRPNLIKKVKFFIQKYNAQVDSGKFENKDLDYSIKWSESLKNNLIRKLKITFDETKIIKSQNRPFVQKWFYAEKIMNDRLTQNHCDMFGQNLDLENKIIQFAYNLLILSTKKISNKFDANNSTVLFPYYRYHKNKDGNLEKVENITDWALEQFRARYADNKIEKVDIFYYIYTTLHSPNYRAKYAINLKQDFPRIPFVDNSQIFWEYADLGQKLMNLHLEPEEKAKTDVGELKIVEIPQTENQQKFLKNTPILKLHKKTNEIALDNLTKIVGIDPIALDYRLGNRSAVEWILEQYKPKREIENLEFCDYNWTKLRPQVIDLLQKVVLVSIETQKIILEIAKLEKQG